MKSKFVQDQYDSDMWHEYLIVPFKMCVDNLWYKGAMHEDVVNEMLFQLGLEDRTYHITDPDTINCSEFTLEIANGKIEVGY